jgi:hypothetical protein
MRADFPRPRSANLLTGGVMPLWLGAGLADWHRHRQTRIEDTAGARESMIHALMMTEAGIHWVPRTLYWDQARALAGFGGERPDFAIRGKRRDPLTERTKVLLIGAMGLFGAALRRGDAACVAGRPSRLSRRGTNRAGTVRTHSGPDPVPTAERTRFHAPAGSMARRLLRPRAEIGAAGSRRSARRLVLQRRVV